MFHHFPDAERLAKCQSVAPLTEEQGERTIRSHHHAELLQANQVSPWAVHCKRNVGVNAGRRPMQAIISRSLLMLDFSTLGSPTSAYVPQERLRSNYCKFFSSRFCRWSYNICIFRLYRQIQHRFFSEKLAVALKQNLRNSAWGSLTPAPYLKSQFGNWTFVMTP